MFPSVGNIVFGVFGLIVGFWVMYNAYYIHHQIYYFGWAEKKLGPGMGTVAYRIVGVCLMLFSIFVLTGWIDLFGSPPSDTGPAVQQGPVIPRSNNGIQIAP
jgi:hypothetical protein